jgi:serine phosphatase RsbU (regulator of sigma subunit)/ligand-binding sensor domain-containing protein
MRFIFISSRSGWFRYLSLVLTLLFFQGTALLILAQSSCIVGHYPIYNFTSKTYGGLDQNWIARQDERGRMYFGNNQGLLEYDGANWKITEVENQSIVYSLDIDKDGRLFLGAENEFGFIRYDSLGNAFYHSLSVLLPDTLKDFGKVWQTFATDSGIYYQTSHHLFIYRNDTLQIISPEFEMHGSYWLGGKLFIRQYGLGLSILSGDQLKSVPGGNLFKYINIYGMLEMNRGRILIFTETEGVYEMRYQTDPAGSEIKKIKTPIENILREVFLYNAIRIDEGRVSIGTWGNGLIIADTSLNLITVVDKSSGLQDDIIHNQYVDRTGNLWLCLSTGISRLEISSDYTIINEREGMTGTIQDCARFNNSVYVASTTGLFYQAWSSVHDLPGYQYPEFNRLENIDIECWDLLTYRNRGEEILLVITNDNVLEIYRNHRINVLLEDVAYDLYQSKLDPSRVFVGLESGLYSLYRSKGQWIKEGKIEGINERIQNISEDHVGNLWMGTEDEGVIKMNVTSFKDQRLSDYVITRYDTTNGLANGPYIVSQITGPPVVATDRGIYRLIQLENRFIPDSTYGPQFADGSRYIHRMSEYMNPDIWLVTRVFDPKPRFETGYLKKQNGHFKWVYKPFNKISDNIIHVISPDENRMVWLGGPEGLYLYQAGDSCKDFPQYHCLISKINYGNGNMAFGGNFTDINGHPLFGQPDNAIPVIPHARNSLIFFFSAYSGNDESFQQYSYLLQGYDKNWSEWTKETKKEYTNLSSGDYIFQVKSIDVYENQSTEASFQFSVLAPWYLKWWAFLIYILLAVGIVYLIVKLYTRQLRQIIKDRTAEVVRKNEIITLKNKDIMDSIQYARRIQTALLPEEDVLFKMGLDGFILFLPRDVVSGDFYWIAHRDDKTLTIAADCTGHGVPGAFLSMVGVAFLEDIIGKNIDLNAAQILDRLRDQVIIALKQRGREGEQKDGMDLALHIIDWKNNKINFAGANNSLVMIQDDKIQTIKADRMPIGIHERATKPFTNHILDARKGDVLYTFSDGFQDQFGGPENKKFMVKNLKDLFLEIHQLPMPEQKKILKKTFYDWIEPYNCEQVDDVLIIGVRI